MARPWHCIRYFLCPKKMKLSRKMWMVMFLAVCLLLVQYHVSTSWLVPASAGGAAGVAALTETAPGAGAGVGVEELVRGAVARLQLQPAFGALVHDQQLLEVAAQLGRDLLGAGCPELQRAESATQGAGGAAPPPPPPPQLPPPPPPPLVSPSSTSASASGSGRPGPASASQNTLYIITPTYRRPEQIPELTRMAQTLMHVRNLFWLVIEDASATTRLVTELLERTGIPFEHLTAPMPEEHKNRRGPKPRGVSNRNRGLAWLRANATTGVFYFADDDNTYDIQLFEEIRTTKRVAMWPVGLCTKFGLSTPIVANGTFKGFYDGWMAGRKFPVDMAGFAVSVEFLLKRPRASMPYKPGYEEDGFLKSLAPFEPNEIELKAQNCTKLLVWHTQTKSNAASAALDLTKYNNTNLVLLKQQIV